MSGEEKKGKMYIVFDSVEIKRNLIASGGI